MKHEIIISSEDFEEFKMLKQIRDNKGAIFTKRIEIYGPCSYVNHERYYISDEELEDRIIKLKEDMIHKDELKILTSRAFRKLKKKL